MASILIILDSLHAREFTVSTAMENNSSESRYRRYLIIDTM